jgi:hypothetical protein
MRDLEDPQQFATMLMRQLGMETDRTATRMAEDVILEAMNEALKQARERVIRTPRYAVEVIDALIVKLNHPV